MTRLLDLPDEILDMIVKHYLLEFRFDGGQRLWSPWHAIPPSQLQSSLASNLNHLVKTSKRFHNLYQSLLHTNVAFSISEHELSKFLRTVEQSPALVHITVSFYARFATLEDIMSLFSLPNINALAIKSIHKWEVPVLNPSQYHKSTVQHLYLPSCAEGGSCPSDTLAYPAALKSLEYEHDYYQSAESRHPYWTSDTLMDALSHHRTTLERLTLTRTKTAAAQIVDRPAIDLSTYTALKSLSITWFMLQLDDQQWEQECYKRMPPLLEHLQVLYDEGEDDYNTVLDEEWIWLKGVLRNKAALPALKKIDIVSCEVPYVDSDDDPDYDEGEYYCQRPYRRWATAAQLEAAEAWTLPSDVMDLAADAGIELGVTLGYGVRLRESS